MKLKDMWNEAVRSSVTEGDWSGDIHSFLELWGDYELTPPQPEPGWVDDGSVFHMAKPEQMKIYLIQGSTGEYSDHCEWLVKAFASEPKAQRFLRLLVQEAGRLRSKYKDYLKWKYPEEGDREPNLLDPNFEWDWSGVNYNILEVELAAEGGKMPRRNRNAKRTGRKQVSKRKRNPVWKAKYNRGY